MASAQWPKCLNCGVDIVYGHSCRDEADCLRRQIVAAREALASLLAVLDDPHGEPGEADQVIMHARNVLERGK